MEHFFFFLASPAPPSVFLSRRISRTSWKNASSTLTRVLAEVSRNGTEKPFASCSPSAVETWRSDSRSHLLPQIMIGTASASLTRRIWSRNAVISSNAEREVMAYTHRKPSPVRMYWSRIAEYSSWPAVSRMSSRHVSWSMITCLRYESSMVGSYSSTKWF
eukprot:Amastigsp_a840986_14082.p2 type:complete len:161 gc:universal Amastigsp_a840986_14082:166-648(+)